MVDFSISVPVNIDQVRKAYDMEEDDETGMENFRIKVVAQLTFFSLMILYLCLSVFHDRHQRQI